VLQRVVFAHCWAAWSQAAFPLDFSRSVAVTFPDASIRMPTLKVHDTPLRFSSCGTCRRMSSGVHPPWHFGFTV
jgi:hypothetical protein